MNRRPPRSTRTAHSFPTRRSSDLKRHRDVICGRVRRNFGLCALMSQNPVSFTVAQVRTSYVSRVDRRNKNGLPQNFRRRALSLPLRFGHKLMRSEEHTSELQSLMRISYAVFCLKKKKIQTYIHTTYQTITK